MNPMTNIKNTQKISEREIELGTAGTKNSWHNRYKDSAWIFIGGLPYDLTEGDVICVFSQCGEIVNCNMVRDQKSGKSKGFMFLCYEDQRSTILAVDNLNGAKILNRTIRVDHVLDYKPPKDHDNDHQLIKLLKTDGCAPKPLSDNESESEEEDFLDPLAQIKREKKSAKKKKKHKTKKSRSVSPGSDERQERKRVKTVKEVRVKNERLDPGYRDMDDASRRDTTQREQSDATRRSQREDNRSDRTNITDDPSYDCNDDRRNRSYVERDRSRSEVDRNARSRRSRTRSPVKRRRSRSPVERRRSRSPVERRRSRSPVERRRSKSPRGDRNRSRDRHQNYRR